MVPNLSKSEKKNSVLALVPYYRGCTIKINLLGFSKFLYHCFLETVGIFTVPNFKNLFGMISEYRLGAIFDGARLFKQN